MPEAVHKSWKTRRARKAAETRQKNKAPLYGTCHNIITYKKTTNPDEIIGAIKSRHESALKNEEGNRNTRFRERLLQ